MTFLKKCTIIFSMQYYIIQVATSREQIFIDNLHKLNPQLAKEHNFIYLTRELSIKRKGIWIKEQQPVFPSYIIVQTVNTIEACTLQALKKIPDFYHFLNSNNDIVPLSNNDLNIIQHFLDLGPKIGTSLVSFDENNRIVVMEGPLKGIEGCIIKVDRRKHRAKIKVDFHRSTYSMDLSFEDIKKQQ